nr:HAD hydrolase-like protein [Ectobacillus panaciterrae]
MRKDIVYRQLIDGFHITKASADDFLEDYIQRFHESVVLCLNVKTTLRKLNDQNIQLAIVTNRKELFQMTNICELGLQAYFSVIVIPKLRVSNGSAHFPAGPSLNADVKGCLFVSDPAYDIQEAKTAAFLPFKQGAPYNGAPLLLLYM